MNINRPDIKVTIKKINNTDCIHFVFIGKLTESDALNKIKDWNHTLKHATSAMPHVWDCTQMTGYEPMARAHWQKAMKELKGKIGKIWLISDSSIIIAGAKLLSLFTSYEINTVKTEEELSIRANMIA